MEHTGERRTIFDIAPGAIVRIVAAIAFVWLWLKLWPLVMVIVVATILAIALDPIVDWLCRHRIPRGIAAALPVLALALLIAGFFGLAGSSLTTQARLLGDRLVAIEQDVVKRVPHGLSRILASGTGSASNTPAIADYMLRLTRMLTSALVVGVLAMILTIYLLVEGRTTYAWLVAYAPPQYRERVDLTACEARNTIRGYVAGNVATSAFAAAFVFVALALLHVPAALLLALVAGIADFVPVLGFIVSAVPAVLLALMVSGPTALAVAGAYVLCHAIENYYVAPKVYGGRLRLSNFAVVVAFAVGAELGGVVGALVALPVAAMVPVVERVWLKEYLARDAVATHQRIQNRSAAS
jgi:predicted PurR-regulated permease PerM